MTLNSPTFLFLFLPVFLSVYVLSGSRFRNMVLLLFSLLFFVWTDPLFTPVLFALVLFNIISVKRIQRTLPSSRERSRWLTIAILVNLLTLLSFKVLAVYGQDLVQVARLQGYAAPYWLLADLPLFTHLPVGISFLIFQAVSMLVDVSRQTTAIEKPFLQVSTYLLMFPKAIAGPMARFREISGKVQQRVFTSAQAADGLRRFMLGFAKKTLIADQLALVIKQGIFNQSPASIPTGMAWLVLICYTLQIYYDFLGYSDMAIGLGQVLGFHFPENFNYPYVSTSISEFWRRWHMTLSNWFRDYVFFPLERKRRTVRWLSQALNIMVVFLLTGLWHGITPPFIVWGLLHGAAIALERTRFGSWMGRLWRPLQHFYALTVIMLGWVFFRSPSLVHAWGFLKTLARFSNPIADLPATVLPSISALGWVALAAGILFASPVLPALLKRFQKVAPAWQLTGLEWLRQGLVLVLFFAGIAFQAGTSFLPFLYGEF